MKDNVCTHGQYRFVLTLKFLFQPAIGIVLGFIGSKMILDFFGKELTHGFWNIIVTKAYFVFCKTHPLLVFMCRKHQLVLADA